MKHKQFPRAWIDPATLFTRQEIAERTGQSDDVLSFWSKRDLLVPAEGGGGHGRHLRYAHHQVSIAAIYTVFRDHFGANIGTLQSLAQLFQGAIRSFGGSNLHPSGWSTAAALGQMLADFRSGVPVMIREHDFDDPDYDDLDMDERLLKRPARSEAEIISLYNLSDHSTPRSVIKLAESLGAGHVTEARVAQIIVGTVLDPEYFADPSWLMRPTGEGWDILEATEGLNFDTIYNKSFGPALYVPVGSILRDVWGLPTYRELRGVRYAEEMQSVLNKHGIAAVVSPADDERFYVYIDAPRASWDAIAPLAAEIISYYELRDPADPGDLSAPGEGQG